jgi:Pyruvate/2-oxoacid:ferredoxin oxidoreductase delta subunit
MKIKRKIIEIDEARCSGCGDCAAACAEGAIMIMDGKARLISENYCDGLGACLGECPEGALTITERESEEFDPVAVEEHLKSEGSADVAHHKALNACGCPSQKIEVFPSSLLAKRHHAGLAEEEAPSALTHWPVQIRLIPPSAPFLRNADLLVAADCTPLAYAGFHRDLLPGKVVMMGCPKFDDVDEYVERFTEIFRVAGIRSISVVDMEVPCCSKLPMIVRKALSLSNKRIPVEEIVVSRRGRVLEKRAVA